MAPVVSIRNLSDHVDEEVTIQGWLYNKTGKGEFSFCRCVMASGICQAVVFKRNLEPKISPRPKN